MLVMIVVAPPLPPSHVHVWIEGSPNRQLLGRFCGHCILTLYL